MPPAPQSNWNPFRWIIVFTRGLLYDQHLRRWVMFYTVLAAALMVFAGDLLLGDWLRERLQRFAVYWLVCGWLTVTAGLLAIYDLLMMRLEHRLARRQLREKIFRREEEKK
jgi:hypothetical protein